jgi:hypothetical protein
MILSLIRRSADLEPLAVTERERPSDRMRDQKVDVVPGGVPLEARQTHLA